MQAPGTHQHVGDTAAQLHQRDQRIHAVQPTQCDCQFVATRLRVATSFLVTCNNHTPVERPNAMPYRVTAVDVEVAVVNEPDDDVSMTIGARGQHRIVLILCVTPVSTIE